MNCPHHIQIYKAEPRSYRDLPVRLAEFGTVYRHEQSGELNGMLRVRGLTQDDAHLFCTPEQVEDEFRATLDLVQFVLEAVWASTTTACSSRCAIPRATSTSAATKTGRRPRRRCGTCWKASGLQFVAALGEAAFYGPKVDFMVRDCIGREWQLGTVQLDYNLPERFQLEYIGADNHPHRPVMIHRAPFGSMERFVGVLIEHFAGAFPLWLAPEQVRVLPLSDKSLDYAQAGRTAVSRGRLPRGDRHPQLEGQAKIRDAQLELIPYMLVVGPKEAEQEAVALRDRIDGDLGTMPIAAALERLREEVASRKIRQVAKSSFAGVEQEQGEQFEY